MSKFKIGDKVEILTTIAPLQPKISKDGLTIEKTMLQWGTVVSGGQDVFLVRPKWRRWETEVYACEIRLAGEQEWLSARNYIQKRNEEMVIIQEVGACQFCLYGEDECVCGDLDFNNIGDK